MFKVRMTCQQLQVETKDLFWDLGLADLSGTAWIGRNSLYHDSWYFLSENSTGCNILLKRRVFPSFKLASASVVGPRRGSNRWLQPCSADRSAALRPKKFGAHQIWPILTIWDQIWATRPESKLHRHWIWTFRSSCSVRLHWLYQCAFSKLWAWAIKERENVQELAGTLRKNQHRKGCFFLWIHVWRFSTLWISRALHI